ncbi:protein valois [Topomyia yanbarensis]|uniref:protein valois n=1 Tax=Topomyia yanbarensis TaxID=2498891 RepID=UPI00273C9C5A|nr:protein valois [Topomyia yanbarensis]
MDYTKRLSMIEMFNEPPEYRPPGTAIELTASLQYPNLNSQQYRMTRKPPANVLHRCLDHVAYNSNGQVVLVGNDLMGRRWGSSFYGWDKTGDVMDASKVCFKKQCKYSITALKFTKDPNLFVLGTDKGSIELWSTQNPARGEGYSLYQVDKQAEHIEGISAMDLLQGDENKLVTGSNDGCLKIWNYGADLHSISTITFAHTDEITGISASRENGSLFVSSSLDRSALMWDLRKPRPASAIFDEHEYAFTALYWTSTKEANQIVGLGDEAGNVHFVDTRQPNVFMHSVQVFSRKIHKIAFNDTNFIVIGNTNQAKFYDEKLILLHESTPAPNYLRDVLWDEQRESNSIGACWLVGWESFFKREEF